MKKIILILLLAGCVLLTLNACNGGGDGSDTTEQTTITDTQPQTEVTTEEETESETTPETQAPMTAKEVAELLASNIYTSDIQSFDNCGLSDPSNVGINKAEFEQVKYPAPDDSVCRKVINAAEYGISTQNDDNSPQIKKLINDLLDSVGQVKVVFPAGEYKCSATITLPGLNRICFCSDKPGEKVTLMMTEWTPCIRLENCADIQFNDFAVDYVLPSAISGKIISVDMSAKQVVIKVDDKFDLSDPHYNGGKIRYGSYMEMYLDTETGDYAPNINANLLYNSTGDKVSNISDGSYNADTHQLTLTFLSLTKRPKADTVVCVAYTMYENFGFYAQNCEGVTLESCNFYHTTGMAIGMGSSKDIYLNRVFLSPREDSGMLMTATADGFHTVSCSGTISVTNCIFEKSHDDCMNINGRYLSVVCASGNTVTLESLAVPVSVGDKLELYSKSDLHPVGVIEVKSIDGTVITADGVTQDMADCFACNITTAPKTIIKNCFFGNKRNRGILVQEPNVVIENCTFRNISHGPIQIFSVPSSFGEGIMPNNATVRNNKFINCDKTDVNIFSWSASGAKAPNVVGNITVTNNYFNGSNYHSVQISTGSKVELTHNLFDDVCKNINQLSSRSVITVECSTDVNVSDNAAVNLNQRLTFANESKVAKDETCSNITFNNNLIIE